VAASVTDRDTAHKADRMAVAGVAAGSEMHWRAKRTLV
jgi:hypothetical protein